MPEASYGEKKTEATKTYTPTDEQRENQRCDQRKLNRDLQYRSRFEAQWLKNADKWNFVAPQGLEGVPNYVVPTTRMATHHGVVLMRQSLPEIVPVPEGTDERKLSYILTEASAHIHRTCNMEGVMDQAIVDFAVLGNMVLQSYVNIPYKAKRIPILDSAGARLKGQYKTVYVRDWSKSKIGTKARSVWECCFDSGARTTDKIRRCWFQDRVSRAEFDELFTNNPDGDYINLDCVEEGKAWTFNNAGDLERVDTPHDRICLDNFEDELGDSKRLYANGVLIWDVALSEVHAHGKCTLSLIPNHHKYDTNRKTHALYGAGDPELLADLDDLINATTNMFILNYQQKNTIVPSIENGGVDVDELDLTSGQPIAGKLTLQSLGQADLPEWKAFKDQLEEWLIQMCKKNYRRLEGEVAKTAYEAAQKKRDENLGVEYQAKKMESGGLLEYAKKHVSDVMEHLTVEEWEDVLDEDRETVLEMLKSGELADEDVNYEIDAAGQKTVVKVKYIERVRTRGKVFKETFKDGKRHLGGLMEIEEMRGQDGWLAASKEYVTTRNWRLFKRVPDIYLVGKTMLGQDGIAEMGKFEQLMGALQTIAALMAPSPTGGPSVLESLGIDPQKLSAIPFDAIDVRREQVTQTDNEQKISDSKQATKAARAAIPTLSNPYAHARRIAQLAQTGIPAAGPAADAGGSPAPQAAPVGAGQPAAGPA